MEMPRKSVLMPLKCPAPMLNHTVILVLCDDTSHGDDPLVPLLVPRMGGRVVGESTGPWLSDHRVVLVPVPAKASEPTITHPTLLLCKHAR